MCYKYYQKYKLNSDADNFLTDEFDNVVNQITDDPLYTDEQENQAIQEQTPKNGGTRGISSDALKYKGYNVAGKIEMPTVRLQYPILGDKVNETLGEKEGIKRKPAPDSILIMMDTLKCKPEETIYVGDSEVDVEAAANAGIKCASVTLGFRDKEDLEKINPLYIADNVQELYELIKG